MRIHSAEAECIDGGSPRCSLVAPPPRASRAQHFEWLVHDRRLGIRARRQRLTLNGEENLEQARGAGAREQVADVRLHRAQYAMLRLTPPQFAQTRQFDGVSDRG